MMKVAVFVLAVVASASAGLIPATTLLRSPAHDSAIIKSERLGGNFAYSSVEGHAYQAVSPVVQHVQTPVAVSYHATPVNVPVQVQEQVAYKAAPVVHTTYTAAAPVVHTSYAAAAPVVHSSYAAPVVSSYAAAPVVSSYGYGAGAPLVHSGLAYNGLGYNGLGYNGLVHSGLGSSVVVARK